MLNREKLISVLDKFYKDYRIDFNDCHVSHGGSMVMLGLRKETSDVDLTVAKWVWDELLSYGFEVKHLPAKGEVAAIDLISVNEYIDVHLLETNDSFNILLDRDVWYRDAERTLKDKLVLNRDKDQEDISLLRNYLL